MLDPELYCTASELASFIGCCTKTAHRRLRAAGYQPTRNGRVSFYPVGALSDFRVVGAR